MSSAGEAIADAGVGADVAPLAGGLDLAPQVGDVRAEHLSVVGVAGSPDGGEQVTMNLPVTDTHLFAATEAETALALR